MTHPLQCLLTVCTALFLIVSPYARSVGAQEEQGQPKSPAKPPEATSEGEIIIEKYSPQTNSPATDEGALAGRGRKPSREWTVPRIPDKAESRELWDKGFAVPRLGIHAASVAVNGKPRDLLRGSESRWAWETEGLRMAIRIEGSLDTKGDDFFDMVVWDPSQARDSYQVFVRPGDTNKTSGTRVVDHRVRRFHDPRLYREELASLPPVNVKAAVSRTNDAYTVEVLFPFKPLGIEPTQGSRVNANVVFFTKGARYGWFPHGWSGDDPTCTHTLRLGGPASPPESTAIRSNGRTVAGNDVWRETMVKLPKQEESSGEYWVEFMPEAESNPSADTNQAGSICVWIPPGTKKLRGVYVTLPGIGFQTRLLDETWTGHPSEVHPFVQRLFAAQNGFALLGTGCAWHSRDRMRTTLARIASQSGHPELADDNLPMIADGFSAGGKWAFYGWMRDKPERMIGVGSFGFLSGGALTKNEYTAPFEPGERMLGIPVVFIVGGKDGAFAGEPALAAVRKQTDRGAPWAVANQPNLGHSVGLAYLLAIPYWNDLVRMRLAEDGNIKPLRREDGWLGDPATRAVRPWDGKVDGSYWFPSRFTALMWRLISTKRPSEVTVADLHSAILESEANP